MKLEDIRPAHCHALATRLLADARAIRDELGRAEDTRAVPTITGAEPREVYFEAIGAWRKAARLAAELGVESRALAPAAPRLADLQPGHVHALLESILAQVDAIRGRLGITAAAAPGVEPDKQPSDVLVTVVRLSRDLSRSLERPFTPADVYRAVALASAYAARITGMQPTLAGFESKRRPTHCYERLEACLDRATALIGKRGGKALVARGTPAEVVPGDVYDLANLVVGELAFLHAITPNAAPLHAFEVEPGGHCLPAHVHQLARTLEGQLGAIA